MDSSLYELERDRCTTPYADESTHYRRVDIHFHYMMEILYAIEGGLRVNVDNEWFTLDVGDYILINSGVPHATENPGGARHYVVSIPKYALMPSLKMLNQNYYLMRDDRNSTMRNLLACLSWNSVISDKSVSLSRQTFLVSLSNSIISFFAMESPDSVGFIKHSDPFLEMISFICDNYYDPNLTTASLAKRFGYTPRMLSDLFMANLKTGVKRYIDILRVNDAKYRLLSTPDSVEVIAAAVGFDSPRSFYRVFSAHTGMSPGRYRNAAPDDLNIVRDKSDDADSKDNMKE